MHYEDFTHDLEQEGRVETALIGLRYVGNRSAVPPNRPRQLGGWPGRRPFQGGPVAERDGDGTVVEREPGPLQLGLNPDWVADDVEGGTLAGLEDLTDFEVVYDPEQLAARMLEMNYLPPAVFGSPPDQTGGERVSPDYDVRTAVFEHLGLDDVGSGPGSHEEYREQLAAIAGVDLESDEAPVDKQRAQQYVDDYTRADLKATVRELRTEEDDITLAGRKLEFAEWLAEQPRQEVQAALEDDAETDTE